MTCEIPRLRMFAGPNGSGKSTFKSMILPELLGIYINPDDIQKEIQDCNSLDFRRYEVKTTSKEVLDFFLSSFFLKTLGLSEEAQKLSFNDDKLIFHSIEVNAYFASVASDFIRNKLIEDSKSFTFETVMSSDDKIELLRNAKNKGYHTCLYYIATEDPSINISRVRYRVKTGGHPVPEDKITSRYTRSLDLLMQAIELTDRSYIFDNSNLKHIWLAKITNAQILEMKTNTMPDWFEKAVWNKFHTKKTTL